LVAQGIEEVAGRAEGADAETLEGLEKVAVDQLDARPEAPVAAGGRVGGQGPVEVVEGRKDLAQELFLGLPAPLLALAGDAPAEVVEVGQRPEIPLLRL